MIKEKTIMWKSYLVQQLKPSLVQEQSMQSLTHAESKSCSSPSLSTHPTCKEMKTQLNSKELLTYLLRGTPYLCLSIY